MSLSPLSPAGLKTSPQRKRVVIVGCGFGGLEAARTLSDEDLEIVIIDRTNHHLFQPLLYQVATAGLPAPSIAAPIRHILRKQIARGNLTVLMGEVTSIDTASNCVLMDGEHVHYDHLILAAGATHSYFGRDDWAKYAPGLKTLGDAFTIRRRVLTAFEQAERENDPAKREPWLTFAVVGAGPTGVEMAGTLAEIAQQTLSTEFRRIDSRMARIILLEGAPRVLGTFTEDLSQRAKEQLEMLGAEVLTGAKVTDINAFGIHYQLHENRPDGSSQITPHFLPTRTVVWAAGVAASPLGRALAKCTGCELDRAGRVVVQPDLSIPGHPNIHVVGDLASAQSYLDPSAPTAVPGVSPGAKQMGRKAAKNIKRRMKGLDTQAFRYFDYGSLATIGKRAAVAMLDIPFTKKQVKFSGFSAWLFWLFVHVYFLIGFRNRTVVLMDWAWAYFTSQRHARVFPDPHALEPNAVLVRVAPPPVQPVSVSAAQPPVLAKVETAAELTTAKAAPAR